LTSRGVADLIENNLCEIQKSSILTFADVWILNEHFGEISFFEMLGQFGFECNRRSLERALKSKKITYSQKNFVAKKAICSEYLTATASFLVICVALFFFAIIMLFFRKLFLLPLPPLLLLLLLSSRRTLQR